MGQIIWFIHRFAPIFQTFWPPFGRMCKGLIRKPNNNEYLCMFLDWTSNLFICKFIFCPYFVSDSWFYHFLDAAKFSKFRRVSVLIQLTNNWREERMETVFPKLWPSFHWTGLDQSGQCYTRLHFELRCHIWPVLPACRQIVLPSFL